MEVGKRLSSGITNVWATNFFFFLLPADKKLCGTAVNKSSARTKEKKELRPPFPTLFTEKR